MDEEPHAGHRTPPNREVTSLTLLAKLRQNEPEAWRRLDHIYGGLIRYWCRRRGVAPGDADDIRQEVFAVVYRKKEEFRRDRPGDTFRGWLRRITANIISNHFRKVNGQPTAEGGTEAGLRLAEVPQEETDEDDPEVEQAALYHRALELIRSELCERDRQVIELTVFDDVEAPEVARRLGMTPGAVRITKYRVLKRMRQELGDA